MINHHITIRLTFIIFPIMRSNLNGAYGDLFKNTLFQIYILLNMYFILKEILNILFSANIII